MSMEKRLPGDILRYITALVVLCAGCSGIYYSALEKIGIEKRELLTDRVEAAQTSQEEAKKQFKNAGLGVRGAFLLLDGLSNSGSHPAFEDYLKALFAKLEPVATPEFITANEVLLGFRKLHELVGRSNRKYPAASEALVRYFQRTKNLPRINLLVDIYNAVSLETLLALGAHDTAYIDGNVALRLTDGTERFVPLGASEPEPVGAGEYCYVDDSNEVICRLEHKQIEKTKVTLETTECFYVIQGNVNTSRRMLEEALEKLSRMTRDFCGGRVVKTWLFADS